ncbi:chromophore lyase CpcT/CpeT [Flavobacterium cheonanense]|uniref:Chromophore lyase CpcT/CpeT n=1 Tax=Flavobacterium cheonanense TaxID=706183 RepID=A0ABP7VXN6_9FLAO|nr:chromophore lyase CpcT/CpeT [Flavobacterium sp.]
MKKIIILLLTLTTLFFSCNSTKTISNTGDSSELKELLTIMQGQYSSEAHSKRDTTYFNISLRMVPIWKNKGHYLYVEQAMFTKQEKPYRVRIYKVSQRGNEFVSEIYTLKNEKEWIGKWKTPEAFEKLSETDIELKQGCEVILKRIGKNKFSGATGNKTCPSELRGASYASSIVTVTKNEILSWDQGFDKNDKQVWGAEKGGYQFVKY